MLRALSHVHMLLSKSCRSQAICTCWFQNVAKTVQFTNVSRNTLQTPCHVVQSADDNFKMLRIPPTCRFELQKVVKKGFQLADVNFKMLRMPCGLPVIAAILQRLCNALKLRTFYSVQISCFRAPWTSQRSLQIWFYMLHLPCNLPMLASHCCKYYPMAKLRAWTDVASCHAMYGC